eukprot:gnl/TRDRNA2_/TRDRNA2_90939_c0_seq1.p1 gnl/TRDRNA2_/TRDRNA2_90939_c0~~gnl/TRDRNA2_/TRDRNA2_90939_c0_seq1.p1  ORF type:complete len:405 (+),score=60.23 gnl/TRDRNA2_/TRDRNA2_90939_c0_seq1:61-1275(+)
MSLVHILMQLRAFVLFSLVLVADAANAEGSCDATQNGECEDNTPTMQPMHQVKDGGAEIVAKLETPPGNIAVSCMGRVLFNFHPQYNEPSGAKIAELVTSGFLAGTWKPRKDLDRAVHTVLSLRFDIIDRLYLLDHADHGSKGAPKMVVFDCNTTDGEDRFLWEYEFPEFVAGNGSMLNDFQISLYATYIYIADTSIVKGMPAILACDVKKMKDGDQNACRRILELHKSVMAEKLDVNVNGQPVLMGGKPFRVGVDSIALDRKNEWLYYGPLTGTTLWRVPTYSNTLHSEKLSHRKIKDSVQRYATKPISDGMSTDASGNVLITAIEHSAVAIIRPGEKSFGYVLRDPEVLQWPDGLCFGRDNWLYVTSSALHHHFAGRDMTKEAPYHIVKMQIPGGEETPPGQ